MKRYFNHTKKPYSLSKLTTHSSPDQILKHFLRIFLFPKKFSFVKHTELKKKTEQKHDLSTSSGAEKEGIVGGQKGSQRRANIGTFYQFT